MIKSFLKKIINTLINPLGYQIKIKKKQIKTKEQEKSEQSSLWQSCLSTVKFYSKSDQISFVFCSEASVSSH